MTAILEDLRRLEAARKRGDITPRVYDEAKRALLGDVEDVQLEAAPPPQPKVAMRERRVNSENTQGMWSLLLIGFCAAGIMTFIVAQLIGDMTIAVTLVVTVFAAILVKAAKRLEP